jgi:AraC-like DNA-binding protein
MNPKLELLFFASFIGAFNSFLLSFYFIRKKGISAFFFGFLLFCLGVRIGKSVLVYFYSETPKTILQIGLTGCFFIGPALFFFLKSEVQKIRVVPRSWQITWLVLATFIVSIGLIYPYQNRPEIWNKYIVGIIYAVWGGFVLASGAFILPLFSRKMSLSEKWYVAIYFGNLLIFSSYLIAFLFPFRTVYISGAVAFSTIFYSLLAIILLQKKKVELFNHSPKNPNKKLDNESAEAILSQLNAKMTNEKLFLNPHLKLSDLATEVNISAHQLSQILNENVGKNFSEFINEYRINEACLLLFTHENLSIDGIGYEVGFNSKSTFFAAFKKQKGVTPAIFQQKNRRNSTIL